MTTPLRWGILGTGGIAHKFATGLSVLDDAKAVAVGSRTQAAADKFADEFNIPRRHDSYEALANDPEVEAIYIATPHPYHKDNTLLCLNAGKAVLVRHVSVSAFTAIPPDQQLGPAGPVCPIFIFQKLLAHKDHWHTRGGQQ